MTDNTKRKKPRGPLVSSRQVVSLQDIETVYASPGWIFGNLTSQVVKDLIAQVGYSDKIVITIEALPSEHPIAPGFEVVAKTRLENRIKDEEES